MKNRSRRHFCIKPPTSNFAGTPSHPTLSPPFISLSSPRHRCHHRRRSALLATRTSRPHALPRLAILGDCHEVAVLAYRSVGLDSAVPAAVSHFQCSGLEIQQHGHLWAWGEAGTSGTAARYRYPALPPQPTETPAPIRCSSSPTAPVDKRFGSLFASPYTTPMFSSLVPHSTWIAASDSEWDWSIFRITKLLEGEDQKDEDFCKPDALPSICRSQMAVSIFFPFLQFSCKTCLVPLLLTSAVFPICSYHTVVLHSSWCAIASPSFLAGVKRWQHEEMQDTGDKIDSDFTEQVRSHLSLTLPCWLIYVPSLHYWT